MGLLNWLLRCVPGLSTLLLFFLFEQSLQICRLTYSYFLTEHKPNPASAPLFWQLLFCAYTLFLHSLGILFPIRLWCAARQATEAVWSNHLEQRLALEKKQVKGSDSRTVTMVIILPAFKESIDTLKETLSVLAAHQDARSAYDLFLAMEERDPNAVSTAQKLISDYSDRFSNIQYTMHPAGIAGESAGKSSNVSWAAKEVERKYNDRPGWKDVLVTVMDSDAHLMDQHFQILRQRHNLTRQQYNYVLYVPPIIFDRNAHLVPRMVRVADLMWCGAGLSCYSNSLADSHVAIPTAVYTLSLPLVRLVNGWDVGSNSIGEDMHMTLKCYFATKGLMKIESLPSPASLCNVSVSTAGIRGWLDNHSARYTQGLRHMWGCLDTGYAIGQWLNMNSTSSLTTPSGSAALGLGPPSEKPTPALLPRPRKNSDSSPSPILHPLHPPRSRILSLRTATVFLRLFEAHFLPAHLFLVLIASGLSTALPSQPSIYLQYSLLITSYMRFLGFALMTIYFVTAYESFHSTCIAVREYETKLSNLYDESAFSYRHRWTLSCLADYLIFPIAGTLYGGIPLFQAAFSHFWTEKLVYLVSAKPVRMIADQAGLMMEAVTKGVEEKSSNAV